MLHREIEKRLWSFHDTYLQTDFLTAKTPFKIMVSEESVNIDIKLGYPHANIKNELLSHLQEWLQPISDKKLNITLTHQIEAHGGKPGIPGLPTVKNVIAVASGKGGVGKSTVAIHLALALAQEGAQVGLLDADIYGPSQPALLGALTEKPQVKDKKFQPIVRFGLQTMSMGFLIEAQTAMAWRGPMLGKAIQQMIYETTWQNLDYLIIDLPPGTGDVQLTLCQKVPVCGAVMVTTPQEMALLDVRRACTMFQQLQIPLLGVVENMGRYACSHCGHEEPIFGENGAEKLAKEFGLTVLQTFPLHPQIREWSDQGDPLKLHQHPLFSPLWGHLARRIAAQLSLQKKDYSSKFPPVVIASNKEKAS